MRSFFKKPDWAKLDGIPGQSVEFYKRSEQILTDIISKQPEDEEAEDDNDKVDEENRQKKQWQDSHLCGSKRRRLSREENKPPSLLTRSSKGALETGETRDTKETLQPPPETVSHGQVNSPPRKLESVLPPAVVEVDSDGNSDYLQPKPPTSRLSDHEPDEGKDRNNDEDDGDDDDLYPEEEYPELARKARERARQHATISEGNSVRNTNSALGNHRTTQSQAYNNISTASINKPPDEPSKDSGPKVKILITSNIPDTTPLIVQRRLHQDLRDVRRAWCHRQGFDVDQTATVFLTWKGRRLFDVTTCKSLGVQDEREKLPLPLRDYYDDSVDDSSIAVHMEAVTEKLFEEQKRQLKKASLRESRKSAVGELEAEDDNDDNDESEVQIIKEKEKMLFLTLKSPGLEELKVKVRSKTLISAIIRSFYEQRRIPADRKIQLIFDGDELDPESTVADNDIADLDAIDVRIK
ncbi:hypothetical protein GX48_06702 [Paracoccidioides brasiliensis]|nr:hypothetical protein GX48_06702 [Paracoccidioides brasiliensis]